jgi:hypothetical protein
MARIDNGVLPPEIGEATRNNLHRALYNNAPMADLCCAWQGVCTKPPMFRSVCGSLAYCGSQRGSRPKWNDLSISVSRKCSV